MQKNYNLAVCDKEIQIRPEKDEILVWTRKPKKSEKEQGIVYDIIMYHNCRTGAQSYDLDEVVDKNVPYRERKRNSQKYIATYWETSSDNQFLCCIVCSFSAKAIKPGEIRNWEEEERYYFTKQKDVILPKYYYGTVTEDGKHRFYNGVKASSLNYDYTHYPVLNTDCDRIWDYQHSVSFRKAAYKIFSPIVTIGGNQMLEIYNPSKFDWFLNYKEPFVKTGPKQKKINELVSYELPKVEIPNLEEFKNRYYWYTNKTTRFFAVISKVKENIACLRTMAVVKSEEEGGEPYLYESGRIYVSDKEVISCKPNNFGEYVSTSLSGDDSQWRYPMIDFDKNDVKGTKLEYFGTIVDELSEKNRAIAVKTFLKYPIIEQLYKGGLKRVIEHGFSTSIHDTISTIEHLLRFNLSEKNFYSIVGLNKNQLNMLNEVWDNYDEDDVKVDTYYHCGYEEIHYLKRMLNDKNISAIDDKTFKTILDFIVKMKNRKIYDISEIFIKLNQIYSLKTAVNMLDSVASIRDEMIQVETRWGYSSMGAIRLYDDYLSTVLKMRNANRNFKAQFKNIAEIKEMHDAAFYVYNTQKDVFKNDAFKEAVKRYQKYAYSDDKYSIVIPELPADLAKEGLELHHCVKTYIDRVIEGKTRILFLRDNNEIDKPFFTIELSNSGSIEQVHGFANRNASTEPGILYFIDDWAKKFKLSKNNYNKVR
jgi:hypothetical protein